MEDRVMLATIVVDTAEDFVDGDVSSIAALFENSGDDGRISLREAILASNATAGPDTIMFAPGLDGEEITIFGDGEQTRDFTYVENVVQANLSALERSLEPGEVLNVGAGERVSLTLLYAHMADLAGVSPALRYGPPRAGDVRHSLASLARVRERLGYVPRVGWREGLARTMEWYRERAAAR